MSKITTTTILCDICEATATLQNKSVQVIFTTDQTEDRGCSPYLDLNVIDLCNHCYETILKGNYVYANGAMGYNNYKFRR